MKQQTLSGVRDYVMMSFCIFASLILVFSLGTTILSVILLKPLWSDSTVNISCYGISIYFILSGILEE